MEPVDQQTANHLATGAPGTITLDGQVYLVGQPTKADFVTLSKRLREMWKRDNQNTLAQVTAELSGIPKEHHAAIIEAAVRAKPSIEPDSAALSALLQHEEGLRFWTWLLLRKHDPVLTQARVAELVSADNVDQVLADLFEAGGMAQIEGAEKN